jgi:hypothetical protein
MLLFCSAWIRIRIELKCWIRIRIQLNPDPQPWIRILFNKSWIRIRLLEKM